MDNFLLKKLNINKVREKGYTGKGIKIAIIDSGVNSIGDKMSIAGGYNFIDKSNNYSDIDGHGTSVASIIKSKEFGIAYDSEIYALKIDTAYDEKSIIMAAEAIDWCINNKIDIINISFGFSGYENLKFESKCREAVDSGIAIICAAGNNGHLNQGLAIPAKYNSTITVSSIKLDNTKTDTSSYGKGIDFCCYGENLLAYDMKGNIINVSGTSFASPCIAAIAALVKEQNKSLKPREIYELLKENTIKIDKNNKKSLYYGYGLINAFVVPKEYKKQIELDIKDLNRNIYFPYSKLIVKASEKIDSQLQYLPDNDDFISVEYKTMDNNIAIVDSEGIVLGRKAGNTNLIAIMNSSKVAITEIEVYADPDTPKPEDNLAYKGLNIGELHKSGIKGKGIKIAYVGYGCIDSEKINLKNRIDLVKDGTKDANNYGTVYCSIISGIDIGIAPEAELYAVKCAEKGGVVTWDNAEKAIQWCIDNKMDIINFSFTNPEREITKTLLKKCYDNNIIAVVNDCGNITGADIEQKSEYSLTVSYVTDKKEFVDKNAAKTPFKGSFVDCVSFGYGIRCINYKNKEILYEVGEVPVAQYYCNIAVAEVMGVLALIKQQDSSINNAKKVRALLPKLCEVLYGGKNDKTGYGLLKAGFINK